jgi:uncharacterized phage protein (TIGR01671 family)
MMRELKFKTYSKKLKRFVSMYDDNIQKRVDPSNLDIFTIDQDELIYLQYAGFKDKEGTKVFEGDIFHCAGVGNCVVTYFGNQARFAFVEREGHDWDLMDLVEDRESWKVIGNIYENPELLS